MMPGQQGLRLDQAPPLAVPLSFFLTVPVAMVAGGSTLLFQGDAALVTPWSPATIARALPWGTTSGRSPSGTNLVP